jgi:hypothetical protein
VTRTEKGGESLLRPAWLGVLGLGLLIHVGCSGHSFNAASGSSTGAGGGGGGMTTTTGAGGGDGGPAVNNGPAATQFVNGGNTVSNDTYQMVFTLGQPSLSQQETSSPDYQMQGGLVGANGSVP